MNYLLSEVMESISSRRSQSGVLIVEHIQTSIIDIATMARSTALQPKAGIPMDVLSAPGDGLRYISQQL
jgi:hypothetical protein